MLCAMQHPYRKKHRVYVAVGSNLGDRFHNIQTALDLLTGENSSTRLVRTSFLHQTAPMYVENQPEFWNGAVLVETDLDPVDLLRRIKDIEASLGRDMKGIRNGPRPVDLDILFCQTLSEHGMWIDVVLANDLDLIVPHPRIQERDFVLIPLLEVAGRDFHHAVLNTTLGSLWDDLQSSRPTDDASAVRVLPLPRNRAVFFNKTICMGILNVTPDSFSDGGKWTSSWDSSIARALEMVKQGADIIDIGGESTRPGATTVDIHEEIERTVPVIKGIRSGQCSAFLVLCILA
jgi:2-amino-4-hydroxy-6-hydroxymethyldihydropteridine diphosphokinase